MDEIWVEMLAAARSVRAARRVSEYVTCGEVSAAVRSRSGRIYTGVCVDTCSTLGICAERNAIFNMLTNGEHEIDRVLAVLPDGSGGAPCGACRELMVQLMPDDYSAVRVLLDNETGRETTLGALTPEWWIQPGSDKK
ncbi:MAG: cytidine deaminase [Clostridia bacterium]|nr:cytidine deaminase [Clostridia bacterium]